jgi:DNA end-binding protein Ku
MAARPLSSATIAFGLVSIPVKLYSAAESAASVHFNQIDRRDGSRIKQQLVSAKTGEIVPKDEIVKGYEFSKNQYVLFTAEELKALEVSASYSIKVDEFVPAESVDRIYFDKAYYLAPDKGGAGAYALFSEALKATKRVAIGRYAARGRQYLIAVRPKDGGLLLEQLHYADEIRSFSEIPLDKVEIKDAELALAKMLIDQLTSEKFEPTRYHDEVRESVLALIERKVQGESISVAPAEEPEHKIVDLMEALKASLKAAGDRKAPHGAARASSGETAAAAAAASAPAREDAPPGAEAEVAPSSVKPKAKKATKKKRAVG